MTPGGRREAADPNRTAGSSAIDQRRYRALSEPLDCRWLSREPYPMVEVRNPIRHTQYRTLWPAYPDRSPSLCTCTDYARRGLGDCKHLEAAWRWLARAPPEAVPPEEPTAPRSPQAVWAGVDRSLAAAPPATERGIREIGTTGRVLIDPDEEE